MVGVNECIRHSGDWNRRRDSEQACVFSHLGLAKMCCYCRKKGFRNLYTLEGGVSNYLKAEGPAGWVGNLFVFDGRLSLPPATFNEEEQENKRWVGCCYVCGSEVVELRHRNCANIDCNRLYLCVCLHLHRSVIPSWSWADWPPLRFARCCGWCAEELCGCCCSDCKVAPRLRPLLPGHQRYLKWHVYRDVRWKQQLSLSAAATMTAVACESSRLKIQHPRREYFVLSYAYLLLYLDRWVSEFRVEPAMFRVTWSVPMQQTLWFCWVSYKFHSTSDLLFLNHMVFFSIAQENCTSLH